MLYFAFSQYMPCPDCGASVDQWNSPDEHVCDEERILDYRMFQPDIRNGIATLELEFELYLMSPHGRFAVWDAQRERIRMRKKWKKFKRWFSQKILRRRRSLVRRVLDAITLRDR